MANARAAQLLEQRRAGRSLYSSSGSIKLLSPTNNSITSIAKSALTAELNQKVSDYNDGLISNTDMLSYLKSIVGNPGLSSADQLQVQGQLRDFTDRIRQDALVTAYKAAPDNTSSQVSAAQALANYWIQKAGSLQPDTPAYTTAVDNANQYSQNVQTITANMNKTKLTQTMYSEEAKVNALPDNTPEQAQAKIDEYQKLYNMASSNGDATNAAKYASLYNNAVQGKSQLEEKQTLATNKKTLSDYINTTLNDYHEGKITGEQAIAQLDQADQFASSIGDTGTQYRITNLGITINREIDKGVTYGVNGKSTGGGGGSSTPMLYPDGSIGYTSTGGGSGSTKSSGGTSAGTGGKVTLQQGNPIGGVGIDKPKSFAELDFEYQNDQVNLNKWLVAGVMPDGSVITPERYQTILTGLVKVRQEQLSTITDWATNVAQTYGADSKVGKAAVVVLNKYSNELQQDTATYNGIQSGQLILAMDDKSHTIQWQPKSNLTGWQNVGGIYHAITVAKDAQGNDILNSDGNKKLLMNIYDTQGRNIAYEYDAKYGWLPVAAGPITGKLRNEIVAEADRAFETGHSYTPPVLSYQDVINNNINPQINTSLGKTDVVGAKTANEFTVNPPTNLFDNVTGAVKPIKQAISTAANIINPQVSNAAPNIVVAPIPVQKLNLPTSIGLGTQGQQNIQTAAAPIVNQSSIPSTPTPVASQPLKLATQAPSPVAQSNAGQPLKNIGSSPVKQQPVIQQPKPSIGTTIYNAISGGINNLKKLFGF